MKMSFYYQLTIYATLSTVLLLYTPISILLSLILCLLYNSCKEMIPFGLSDLSSPKSQPQLLNLRNAIIHRISDHNNADNQKAIIYLTSNHDFIICNNFENNKLNDYCLIYHGHSRYQYGYWVNNKPHGKTVFRIKQTLIIAEYYQGSLQVGSQIVVIFEDLNKGAILKYLGQEQWQNLFQQSVLNSQQLHSLIAQCEFKSTQPVFPSLLKFINHHIVSENRQSSVTLRQLRQGYYRLGCDEGLAIIIDDQFKIISVGIHKKSILNQIGAKFHGKDLNYLIEEGIFQRGKIYSYTQHAKPHSRLQKAYYLHHLTSLNFINNMYTSPANQYLQYFAQFLQSETIKELLNDLVFHQRQSSVSITSSSKSFQQIKSSNSSIFLKEEVIFPSLRKETIPLQIDFFPIQQKQSSFESLNKNMRLDIIKKQVQSAAKSKNSSFNYETNNKSNAEILEFMSPIEKQQKGIEKPQYTDYVKKLQNHPKKNSKLLNLQKKIDIVNPHYKETPRKKRIFSPFNQFKKDYSPSPSPNRSRSRDRAKIFEIRPFQKSNSKKIIRGQDSPYFVKTIEKQNQNFNYQSPMNFLDESSIQRKSHSKSQQRYDPQPASFTEKQKKFISNYQGQRNNIKQNQDKIGLLYNNPIKRGPYKQYVYEPIDVSKNVKKQQPNKELKKQGSKKIIETTQSKQKLSRYMNPKFDEEQVRPRSPFKRYNIQ